jgi:hypothetical protein
MRTTLNIRVWERKMSTLDAVEDQQAIKGTGTEHLDCLNECIECHNMCTETLVHCLEKDGGRSGRSHMRLLMDCADICQISANYLLRGSDLHRITCRACADICDRCAEACANFKNDDQMQNCAEVCWSCAASCQQMAAGA